MNAMQLYPQEIHGKFLLNHKENLLLERTVEIRMVMTQ